MAPVREPLSLRSRASTRAWAASAARRVRNGSAAVQVHQAVAVRRSSEATPLENPLSRRGRAFAGCDAYRRLRSFYESW